MNWILLNDSNHLGTTDTRHIPKKPKANYVNPTKEQRLKTSPKLWRNRNWTTMLYWDGNHILPRDLEKIVWSPGLLFTSIPKSKLEITIYRIGQVFKKKIDQVLTDGYRIIDMD